MIIFQQCRLICLLKQGISDGNINENLLFSFYLWIEENFDVNKIWGKTEEEYKSKIGIQFPWKKKVKMRIQANLQMSDYFDRVLRDYLREYTINSWSINNVHPQLRFSTKITLNYHFSWLLPLPSKFSSYHP